MLVLRALVLLLTCDCRRPLRHQTRKKLLVVVTLWAVIVWLIVGFLVFYNVQVGATLIESNLCIQSAQFTCSSCAAFACINFSPRFCANNNQDFLAAALAAP